jgi:PIN domain nuclease of toxin-antitoxin system
VLDTSAVLAWARQERGGKAVERVLRHAALSTVNLAEVLCQADKLGVATTSLADELEAVGVRFVPFTEEDAGLAEEVHRTARRDLPPISLADCCCLATGIRLNLPVVGGDQAWEALQLGIDVHPIR